MTKKSNEIIIFEKDHEFWTTSIDIAQKFGKRHHNVTQAIRNLDCSSEFNVLNFKGIEYKDSRGRTHKMYNISRDGFAFLAMGFVGKEAATWKEKYIRTFNQLEKIATQKLRNKSDSDTSLSRIEGKVTRRKLTDVIKVFIEYARKQGSSQPEMYYMTISKLSQRLFEFNDYIKRRPDKRDYLESVQLNELANIEEKLAQAINLGMEREVPYKSIYKLCKERVEKYIEIFGTSPVIAQIEQTQYSLLN